MLAPRVLVEAALPGMRERGWGRIVNVGSTSIVEPIPASDPLERAPAGRGRLPEDAGRARSRATGITVNTVATGRFATDRLASNWGSWEAMESHAHEGVPAGRLGTPEEYGDLVAFLCSERAAYLTGTLIPLDGGLLRSV